MLPIEVVPTTPGLLVSPIVLLKVIFPSPDDALTLNPPSALVAPIAPLKVTSPVPDVITNKSLNGAPAVLPSIAPPKLTVPPAVPVLIVVVPLLARSTPDVAKLTLSFVVVNVAAPVISMFWPAAAVYV